MLVFSYFFDRINSRFTSERPLLYYPLANHESIFHHKFGRVYRGAIIKCATVGLLVQWDL